MSNVNALNGRLASAAFMSGSTPTTEDAAAFKEMFGANTSTTQWAARMASYYESERQQIAAAASPAVAAAAKHADPKAAAAAAAPAKKDAAPKAAPKEEPTGEDKFAIDGAIQGAVVTRFPPEASGFLHIGHAKAALTNSILRTKYAGKLIFRFDDTNPEKENPEFEKVIIDDMALLGIKYDVGPTYSSDYFDVMLGYANGLIAKGDAYCDFTPKEEMRECRFNGIATKCRVHSVEENQRLWAEMQKGSELGQTCCLRAKMSIDDNNKALRDPVMYRVNVTQPHPRTGDKYKVYPTYDFCCPIVDSLEGVTHALRTNEYHDRNDQFYWFCDKLEIRKPAIEDFSRLNLEYTLMSKRKLTQLVDTKVVTGWDDPRFPTVRGLLRRGLKVSALKSFVEVQGMSKSVNIMEWSKLWNFNNQDIDPIAPRYTAVSRATTVKGTVTGGAQNMEKLSKLRHKKNEALGEKTYFRSDSVLLDAEDILLVKEGDEVTLMDWGNMIIKKITTDDKGVPTAVELAMHLEGDVKKTKYKLTWIADNAKNVVVKTAEYDHILTKKKLEKDENIDDIIAKVSEYNLELVGEEAMAEVKAGDFIQVERRGFYRCDSVAPITLIAIPDGRDKINHLSAKAQWVKVHEPKAAPGKAGKKADEGLSLAEKRALKAAQKAAAAGAAGGKKDKKAKNEDEKKAEAQQ